MNLSVVIGAPFVSPKKFAEITGQEIGAVNQQIKDDQLPVVVLPQSPRQKDPSSSRRKKFVNLTKLFAMSNDANSQTQILDFDS